MEPYISREMALATIKTTRKILAKAETRTESSATPRLIQVAMNRMLHLLTLSITDTTAPTVQSVSSTTANGTYTTGDTITINVVFSEAVTVNTSGGTPQLTLETGSTDQTASYSSGSGTNTLAFSYTVQNGDTSSDLNYKATSSLALNGATIQDSVGNNAALTLPALASSDSLAANNALVIDTTAPTVQSVSSSTADGTYTTGDTITINVVFSEAVTVNTSGGTPQLTLETGSTDQTASYSSGSGTNTLAFSYTVQDGDTSSDLNYKATTSLALNGATIQDSVGNNAALTLPALASSDSLAANNALVIDTTAPTVQSVSSTTANGTYTTGDVITINVVFSEAVTVNTSGGTPQLTLETGSTDQTASYSSGSGTNTLAFSYTVQNGDTASDLNYTATTSLALNGASIQSSLGNNAALTLPALASSDSLAGNSALVIDTTAPTVQSVSSSTADGTYTTGDTITINVVFSEAVTVNTTGGTPQLTLETGSTDQTAAYSSGSGTNTLAFSYTVQNGDTSSDLNYTATTSLALNGATIQDSVGNNAALTLPALASSDSLAGNSALVIDTTAPTVQSVSSSTADGTYTTGDTITINVVFSEDVTVNTTGGTPQLTLETGSTDQTASYSSGSGTNTLAFSYTVQDGDAASDLNYKATTSLALNGATIQDGVGNNAALTLPALASSDSLAGNSALVIDTTAPTVQSVSSSTADGTYTTGDTITINVVFSEDVTVNTSGGTPQLTLETGSTDQTATYSSGSGTNTLAFSYTVQDGDTASDLNYTATTSLALNGATIQDAAGNNAALTLPALASSDSLAGNSALVIDTTAPTVQSVSSSSADGTYTTGDTITINVVFSRAVTVNTSGGTPQLTLETGSTDQTAFYSSGSGTNTLAFSYTVQDGDTAADLNYKPQPHLALNGASIRDGLGTNATLTLPALASSDSLAGNSALVIDTTAPVITGPSAGRLGPSTSSTTG